MIQKRDPPPNDLRTIRVDDLSSSATRELLEFHLASLHASSGESTVFSPDLSHLTRPGVTVWTIWQAEQLLAVAALKQISATDGEVRSMRTHPRRLRQGAAGQLLDHLIVQARKRGIRRLSLMTGSGPTFEAAAALYFSRGFSIGNVFGEYVVNDVNRFMHLAL